MIAKFLPYLKAHRWQVAWALAQVFLVAGVELLKPWPLQIVIDYVLGGKTPPVGPNGGGLLGELLSLPPSLLLLLACVALVIVHFSAGALTLWHNYTTIRVGQSMVNDLRGDLYAHLQLLSLADHGGQLRRPDDDHERGAADPLGADPARRHAACAVSDGSLLDPAVLGDRPGPLRSDRRVQ